MAPESILGTVYNLKIDVYSWSIVFYEMLGMQKPFDLYNCEVHQIIVCEGGQRPTLQPYWPEEIQNLLQKAWAQDPRDRPSIKQIRASLAPLVDLAERQMLLPPERSMGVIFELSDLLALTKASVSDLTATTETMSSLNQ
jgi:serine/threonine protein kinase